MMKNRKGFVSFDALICGAIALSLLAVFMPKWRLQIGEFATVAGDQILAHEQKTGEHVAVNPSGAMGVDPNNYVIDNSILGDKVITTQKLYFANPYISVNTDDMTTLTVLAEPNNRTDKGIHWEILSGGEHAHIIKSLDEQSVEITGRTPGTIVLRATAKDASGKFALAYVDVIRKPKSIALSTSKLELNIDQSATVTATVSPADTTEDYVIWSYDSPMYSECTNFTTDGHNITITAVEPSGISCENALVKIRASASDPNVYTVLEVAIKK